MVLLAFPATQRRREQDLHRLWYSHAAMGLLVLRSLRLLDMFRSSQRTGSSHLFREILDYGTFAIIKGS